MQVLNSSFRHVFPESSFGFVGSRGLLFAVFRSFGLKGLRPTGSYSPLPLNIPFCVSLSIVLSPGPEVTFFFINFVVQTSFSVRLEKCPFSLRSSCSAARLFSLLRVFFPFKNSGTGLDMSFPSLGYRPFCFLSC